MIKELLRLLNTADDETLMMSRLNCHGAGLHSIVLRNDNGKLIRCFITEPNHEMYKNLDDDFNIHLGVHNHRYSIRLRGVFGQAINVNYVKRHGVKNVARYKFESILDGGKGSTFDGLHGLKVDSVNVISDLFLSQKTLHTVYVPKNEMTCWLVYEGDEVTKTVWLYQNGDPSPSSYDQFTNAGHIKYFVKRIIDQALLNQLEN